MVSIEDKHKFFEHYNILEYEFEYNELDWEALKAIYYDYQNFITEKNLQVVAEGLVKTYSQNFKKIHLTCCRIKSPGNLIAKIIREKFIDKNKAVITITNYRTEVEDLIGIRLLHVFKDDWKKIHERLKSLIQIEGIPTANYRDGDDFEFINDVVSEGIKPEKDENGYRSIHYKTKHFVGCNVSVEIQVRTLFEEAWSEISHETIYPNNQKNHFLKSYFKIYNRLSGSLDEMGTFIREAFPNELFNSETVNKKNLLIDNIENKLADLIHDESKLAYVKAEIESLRLYYPEGKTIPAEILPDRKSYYTKAIECLGVTDAYYRTVIEGPFFLHPEWVVKLRNEKYDHQMPNQDVQVKNFIDSNLTNQQADICLIIRNSKRYISKLDEIIPVESREQFKTELINNIYKLAQKNSEGKVKILCLKTGIISVSEIYKNCALESDKRTEDDPLSKGKFHIASPFVEERRNLFDSFFTERFDNNSAQIEILISFINSLWSK